MTDRTPDTLAPGMVILWGLGDTTPTPHTIDSIDYRPGHGYAAWVRPEGSPYASGIMLYPHLTYPVVAIPHDVLATEALNDWKSEYTRDGMRYCADHPGHALDYRYGCRICPGGGI